MTGNSTDNFQGADGHNGETDFGFRRVAEDDHPSMVQAVFDSVAPRYDLMNDLMSGGLHRLWKQLLINRLNPSPGMRLIDVAGGTGDIAGRFLARVGEAPADGGADTGRVTICDLNSSMLGVGKARFLDSGIVHGADFICANAESLPLADGVADACTIAFGLRNVTRRGKALGEMRRVLKPGGHFLCLEFSPSVLPSLAPLYEVYSHKVLPALGRAITGDGDAYRYLVESIRRFPAPNILAAEMRDAGFGNATFQPFSGGIVALHSGWRT